MLGDLQYQILKRVFPRGPNLGEGTAYLGKSKAKVVLGEEFLRNVAGKTIIDFGCWEGAEAIDMARCGAKTVIGVDYREASWKLPGEMQRTAGLQSVCQFATSTKEIADIVVSIDAFEHFDDPAAILKIMDKMLKPDGSIVAVFGPTWYHPLGGHSFSIFPWSHLVFSEEALLRWRSDFRPEGATKFSQIGGGLNQITIKKFEAIVKQSHFEFDSLEAVPIRKVRFFHNALTREFFSALVRCRLVRRSRLPAH